MLSTRDVVDINILAEDIDVVNNVAHKFHCNYWGNTKKHETAGTANITILLNMASYIYIYIYSSPGWPILFHEKE